MVRVGGRKDEKKESMVSGTLYKGGGWVVGSEFSKKL